MNVLVAGVGYRYLRDLSFGPTLVTLLQQQDWPPGVEIHDLSFGPIAVVQWLQERPAYFRRAVFVAGVERGREAGRLYIYLWDGALPDPAEIQVRVGEAVTGVISLDNLLIIAQHFQVLPPEVIVVEVEPADTGWGPGFTPDVEALVGPAAHAVRQAVLHGQIRFH